MTQRQGLDPRTDTSKRGDISPSRADVVLVPDFAGPNARRFELLSLLFLGAWKEHAGAARSWPMQLACIGAPPPRVERLARDAGALISVHEPLRALQCPLDNKLRGLEVACRTDHLLLLDLDIITLRDPSPLLAGAADLMASPASVPRVPDRMWKTIYPALGLPLPPDPIPCVMQEGSWGWGPESKVRDAEGQLFSAHPYFNTGVLVMATRLVPRLRQLWLEDMARMQSMFGEAEPFRSEVTHNDQTAFSTAVTRLQREGAEFRVMPAEFNARWHHLFLRMVPFPEICFYHAFRLGDYPVSARRLLAGSAYLYPLYLWHRLALLAVRQRRKLRSWSLPARQLIPSWIDAYRLSAVLRRLARKYVGSTSC